MYKKKNLTTIFINNLNKYEHNRFQTTNRKMIVLGIYNIDYRGIMYCGV